MDKVSNIFGIEPLHNLFLGISKLKKKCSSKFLGSDGVITKPGKFEILRKPPSEKKVSIQRGMYSLLVSIERKAGVLGLHVDFSSNRWSMQWNGLFLNSGVFEMFDGKD